MAGKICHIVLMILLASVAARFVPDWEGEMHKSLDEMNRNLYAMTHNIEQQMQQSTRSLQAKIQSHIDEIKNLPKNSEGHIINQSIMTDGDVSIATYRDGNILKTIIFNRTLDGQVYKREIKEESDGVYLYHNETSFNPITNEINWTIRWELDLTTADAQPEFITEES